MAPITINREIFGERMSLIYAYILRNPEKSIIVQGENNKKDSLEEYLKDTKKHKVVGPIQDKEFLKLMKTRA